MPKIGMPSCAVMALPWTRALEEAAKHGFEAFEISCVFPSVDPERIPRKDLLWAGKLLEKAGMEVCVHAPFYDLNIAAFSRGVRKASVEILRKTMDFCARLGGRTMILHSGTQTYESIPGLPADQNPLIRIQWNHNIDSLKRIQEYALKKKITLCLENIGFNSVDQSFQDLLDIRKEVGEALHFTLDFGHARLREGGEKAIRLLGRHIRHIHLHDNFGKVDDHLPVGEGDTDFSGFIDFLRTFPHIITLEVVNLTADPQPALRSRRNLQSLMPGPQTGRN